MSKVGWLRKANFGNSSVAFISKNKNPKADGPNPKWILSREEGSGDLTQLFGVRQFYQESKSKNSRMKWALWKLIRGFIVSAILSNKVICLVIQLVVEKVSEHWHFSYTYLTKSSASISSSVIHLNCLFMDACIWIRSTS